MKPKDCRDADLENKDVAVTSEHAKPEDDLIVTLAAVDKYLIVTIYCCRSNSAYNSIVLS